MINESLLKVSKQLLKNKLIRFLFCNFSKISRETNRRISPTLSVIFPKPISLSLCVSHPIASSPNPETHQLTWQWTSGQSFLSSAPFFCWPSSKRISAKKQVFWSFAFRMLCLFQPRRTAFAAPFLSGPPQLLNKVIWEIKKIPFFR